MGLTARTHVYGAASLRYSVRMMMLIMKVLLTPAFAGGGPANVMVLANANDTEAIAVAEHYESERALPPGHVCLVEGVNPAANTITLSDYALYVAPTIDDCLATLPQPEEIDILVLVRGLPYRVDLPTGFTVSLEAMAQISNTTHRTDGEALAGHAISDMGDYYAASVRNPFYVGASATDDFALSNAYMAHYSTAVTIAGDDKQPRSIRRQSASEFGGWEFTDNLFLVSRLDGFDHDDAMDLVDRGVAADGSFPVAPITCMAAADSARGARDPECHFTVDLLQAAGFSSQWIESHDPSLAGETLAGFMTGTTTFQDGIDGNTLVPGAFTGNLTSFGAAPKNFRCTEDGTCPENEAQTSIARFVRGGATFAHGTTNEPLNNSFPGAGMFLLSTMGYGVIESAFFTQRYLYWQNIYLGDPLSSPWAIRPVVSIDSDVPENVAVHITATHPDGIAETRLYADGVRVDETLPLSASITAEAGMEIELLAVAIAENAPVTREGWPQAEQQPRPDVQGWAMARVIVAPATEAQDTGDDILAADTGIYRPPALAPDKDGGCSTVGSGSLSWMWLISGLLCWTRREAVA
jgi:uncharacterized protein (TIGR03790 family)